MIISVTVELQASRLLERSRLTLGLSNWDRGYSRDNVMLLLASNWWCYSSSFCWPRKLAACQNIEQYQNDVE